MTGTMFWFGLTVVVVATILLGLALIAFAAILVEERNRRRHARRRGPRHVAEYTEDRPAGGGPYAG